MDRFNHKSAVRKAVKEAGGNNSLARKLGISSAAVSKWEKIPIRKILAIEKLTGISRHDLNPEIYPVE